MAPEMEAIEVRRCHRIAAGVLVEPDTAGLKQDCTARAWAAAMAQVRFAILDRPE